MILSGNIVAGSHLARAGAAGLSIGILVTATAPACGPDHPCAAEAIDGFFMPLIARSLSDTARTKALSPSPPLPSPAIIDQPPLPEIPPPPPDATVPVQRLLVGQTLFATPLQEGGDVHMFFQLLPSTGGVPDTLPDHTALSNLALRPDMFDHDMLAMEHIVTLPAGDFWPLQSLSQPVAMRVTCGACGPDGGLSQFDGTGRLEIQIKPLGSGKITNIDLQTPGGSTAHGEMRFTLRSSLQNVFSDNQARLQLVIDQETINLDTRLVAWRGAARWMAGLFVGVPEGDDIDPGGFAGQFSGAGCVPVCGAEN